jgi:hypothetical protein
MSKKRLKKGSGKKKSNGVSRKKAERPIRSKKVPVAVILAMGIVMGVTFSTTNTTGQRSQIFMPRMVRHQRIRGLYAGAKPGRPLNPFFSGGEWPKPIR